MNEKDAVKVAGIEVGLLKESDQVTPKSRSNLDVGAGYSGAVWTLMSLLIVLSSVELSQIISHSHLLNLQTLND